MRHSASLAAWLAFALISACSTAGARGDGSVPVPDDSKASVEAAQELRQLQQQWRRALSARDTAFFQRVLADEFLLTGDATTQTKSDFLLELADTNGTVPEAHAEETNIRLFGNFAVTTGLVRYDLPGNPTPVTSRFTEVWVRRDGQWQNIHGHYNPLSVVQRLERPEGGSAP
jgi:ketosteroid isomerase-like protein